MITIKNECLTVDINPVGAEFQSIRSAEREYLWHGDPAYWSGRSPILFPLTGNVWEKKYMHNGVTYDMPAHGFARHLTFEVVAQSESAVRLAASHTAESLLIYPFLFRLEVEYRLEGMHLSTRWIVTNQGLDDMPFRIGGHPSFLWDWNEGEHRGSLVFDAEGPLQGTLLDQKGCVHRQPQFFEQPLEPGGVLPLKRDYFDPIDTLILEGAQVHSALLRDNQEQPIVRISFDCDVFCIWTPTGKRAPFVCLEPWYGRCDRNGDTGEFALRDYVNTVAPHDTWQGGYKLEFFA